MWTLIFISLFLSSAAEARQGSYNHVQRNSPFDCTNCDKLGVSLRLMLPRGTYYMYRTPKNYKPPIWPSLPAKGVPYLR